MLVAQGSAARRSASPARRSCSRSIAASIGRASGPLATEWAGGEMALPPRSRSAPRETRARGRVPAERAAVAGCRHRCMPVHGRAVGIAIQGAPQHNDRRSGNLTGVAVQPLFVFSVTRSGSTLVQRVLGSYDEIATVSEPWILFPHLYARRKRGIWAEYTHYLMVEAIEDFGRQLPGGRERYREEVRRHILRLYELAAGNAGVRYFLDKTPPYFLIVDEVMDLFPEGRFVFLWRSPLSVAASLIEWDGERWDPARYAENLFVGPARLTSAYSRNRERACAVRYEDLVTGGLAPWRRISDYLGLEFRPETLSRFASVRLEGRMGDPTGPRRYEALSTEPLTKR